MTCDLPLMTAIVVLRYRFLVGQIEGHSKVRDKKVLTLVVK
jgi:hypothetical protein